MNASERRLDGLVTVVPWPPRMSREDAQEQADEDEELEAGQRQVDQADADDAPTGNTIELDVAGADQ